MDPDPDPAAFVLHQVDVVVAGSNGAELVGGVLGELALRLEISRCDLVEHRVIGALGRGRPSERDPARDLAHDPLDPAERLEVSPGELGARRLVAAADVVSDAGRRDVALVGDRAADRLAVPRVVIGGSPDSTGPRNSACRRDCTSGE